MGVKLGISKPELYDQDEYLLTITGHEIGPDQKGAAKLRVKFVIQRGHTTGPKHTGKTVSRKFNPTIGTKSALGMLMMACGIDVSTIPGNAQVDLDILTGKSVYAFNKHYSTPNGVINSLDAFRRADGAPQAAPAAPQGFTPPAAAPQQGFVPQGQPAPAYQAPAAQPVYQAPANPAPATQGFVPQGQPPAGAPPAGAPPAGRIDF